MPDPLAAHPVGWLRGWKVIAGYCGLSPRQLRRYRDLDGLPVTRVGTACVTSAALLDRWLTIRARPEYQRPPLRVGTGLRKSRSTNGQK